MAKVHGKNGYASIDGTNMSQYFNNFKLSETRKTEDTTTFTSNAEEQTAGHKAGTFSIDGFFDPTAAGLIETAFEKDSFEVILGPAGNGAGSKKKTFNAIITSFDIDAPADGMVKITASCVVTGGVTNGTF